MFSSFLFSLVLNNVSNGASILERVLQILIDFHSKEGLPFIFGPEFPFFKFIS